jgi:hypothetical protein
MGLLKQKAIPDIDNLQRGFSEYEKTRGPRNEVLLKTAHASQQLEGLEDAYNKFMNLQVFSRVGLERVLPLFSEACVPAACLEYIPPPNPRSILPYEDEVNIKPGARSEIVAKTSIFLALLATFISAIIAWLKSEKASSFLYQLGQERFDMLGFGRDSTSPSQGFHQIYSVISMLAINGLWEAESYRLNFFLTSLSR